MSSTTRRQMLSQTASALTASALAGVARAAATNEKASPVVDTHLHCFGGFDPQFPYHERAPYRPADEASPGHLLKCMDEAAVDYAVVVHPEPYQDNHHYLEYCLAVGGDRLKATCLYFADRPGSVDKMPLLVKRNPGKIIAARVHAYAPGRLPPFGTPELRHLWQTASDLGLAIQLHFEPRYAPGFEPLIKEFSDTTVIIDHLGRPMQGTIEEHKVVLRWARFSNTVMKVSSLPDQNKYPHRDVRPVVKQLTDAFGADRMVYGGGFNAQATGVTYRAYRQQVAELLSHVPADDRAKILGGTAARLFGFGDA